VNDNDLFFISSPVRAMYCFVDPIFGRRIFTRIPAFLFLIITIPAFVASTLLVIFYWYHSPFFFVEELTIKSRAQCLFRREVMSLKGEKVIGYLDKFRVPCIVVVAVLFAAEIICIYYFSALGFCFFINI
jgi:hypothetical protein